jgi:hypothetical protein
VFPYGMKHVQLCKREANEEVHSWRRPGSAHDPALPMPKSCPAIGPPLPIAPPLIVR